MDTVIEPFAQILGRTRIGENCRIGTSAIVTDSELADDVEIGVMSEGGRGYALDAKNAEALWKKSEELVGESF